MAPISFISKIIEEYKSRNLPQNHIYINRKHRRQSRKTVDKVDYENPSCLLTTGCYVHLETCKKNLFNPYCIFFHICSGCNQRVKISPQKDWIVTFDAST